MKVITEQLLAHFNGNLTTLATCWKVTRRDGLVLGFTDHDVSKVIDGVTYLASSGYFRTAIANSATVSVDNLEIRGFLDNNLISEVDLRNGAYDFAEIEIFAINWADLSQGICRLRYGFFGEVTLRPSGLFIVELRGLMQLFSQTVGETISPDCRADLGDHRCKVKLLPDVRRQGKAYAGGARVVVPQDNILNSVNVPIENANFDWYASTSYFMWQAFGAVITNYPMSPKVGTYYVRPTGTSGAGSARRRLNINPPTGTSKFEFKFSARAQEPGWQVGGLVEITNISGIGGATSLLDEFNTTVLSTHEILYQDVHGTNEWMDFSRLFEDVVIPSNANNIRITMRWRRSPAVFYDYLIGQTAGVQLDHAQFWFDEEEITDQYMSMSTVNPAVVSNVVGWSGSGNQTHPGNSNLRPETGIAFLRNATHTTGLLSTQTVNISAIGADLAELDDENYRLRCVIKVGAYDWGYTGLVTVQFRTAGGSVIGSLTTGHVDLKPSGEWLEWVLEGIVPVNTRQLTFNLGGGRAVERTGDGSSSAVGFDAIDASLIHKNIDMLNTVPYAGVEYQAVFGGTTGITTPAFTHTLGEEVADGSIIWRAVNPQYTFLGEITEVFNHSEFILSGIDAADNWFTWGVLRFLSGSNRGRGVEVVAWNNSTKRMTIMLPALVLPEVGDVITVHAGCDKTRGAGGCLRYGNILNYRGEPEVPGTDQYFRVGGTGAQGAHSTTEL